MQQISSEQLIAFIYNELSETESAIVKQKISEDWNIRIEYEHLQSTIQELNTIEYSPNEQSIKNILSYAAATN